MTTFARRSAALLACAAAFGFASSASAQDKTVTIGVLNDMSSLYADIGGPGSVVAVKMAVEDSGLAAKGWKIEVVSGDHQNKPDVGVNIARQWIDTQKVDMITDTPNSGVALAVSNVAKEKNIVLLNNGGASADLTGKACNANTISFTYDTYMLANGTGKALTKAGGDTWFFLTADYAFGAALERDTSAVVTANGGKVLGGVKHPLNTSDFSSFLLQAQNSKADVVAFANAGQDTDNAIKQSGEFGLVQAGQKLVGLLMFDTDVHAVGLQAAQGTYMTTASYWNMDDKTRAWSKRFFARTNVMPTMIHTGVYGSVLHYLKAIKAAGTDDPAAVMAKMRELPVEDTFVHGGKLREDGRVIRDMYLARVKKPSDSKEPWDYLEIVKTIRGEDAYRPVSESKCALLKK